MNKSEYKEKNMFRDKAKMTSDRMIVPFQAHLGDTYDELHHGVPKGGKNER